MLNKITKSAIFALSFFFLIQSYGYAAKKINIVTTSEDLACLVKEIGGERIKIVSLSRSNQDLHYVEPRPSMVLKMRKADLLVKIGMDLDIWVNSIIDASRNSNVVYGSNGYVDASIGIKRLDVPAVKVDASMGHLHIYGNPHYLIGPQNIPIVMDNIIAGLIRVSPEDEKYFRRNMDEYMAKFKEAQRRWETEKALFKGTKIVTYHKSLEYLAEYLGLEIVGNLEPKPGIPPSPAHLNALIEQMKMQDVKLIIQEIFYSKKTGEMVARETGIKLLVIPTSVGIMETQGYIELIDQIVEKISTSLK